MGTATRRAASRKAMRVATVFTGAAATAVAFAPTALAAPGHAPAQGHTAVVNGKTRAMAPDVQHSGSIRSKGCNSTDVHWLHIQYESLFQRKLCKAFGFRGVKLVSMDFSAECGGTNHGTIFWNTGSLRYGPGNTYRSVTRRNISAVSISFWSGTDQCRWPR